MIYINSGNDALLQAEITYIPSETPPEETIPENTEHEHTFGEWEIVDSSEEGVLVERSCVHCEAKEQKLLEPQDLGPSNPPTAPTDVPTDPTNTTTEPTQTPTDAPTEPTQVPADPTQPDITVTEDPKPFPWAIVVIAVVAAAAAAAGILLGRKRK
jgi:hypothetical protein